MGIKSLNPLLKRVCGSNHITLVPMRNFAGKKIAIDATLYVCAFKMRNNYIEAIIEFLTLLRQNCIHPFFVFDGVAPEEKRDERAERACKRAAARDRIRSLERDLECYKQTGELSDALKAIDSNVRRLVHTKVSVERIQEYIDRLKSQVLSLDVRDFDTMKTILDCFGVHYITASGEGEFLCAALSRHGLVEAVMSSDTDTLACLAPRVITKIEGDYFHVVTLDDILSSLKLSEQEFVDLCIMCGTDFNSNIPKIGSARSYELISKYKSIDMLPPELDVSCLRHKRVRDIFSFSNIKPDITVPVCDYVNYDKLSSWTQNVENIKMRLRPKIKSDQAKKQLEKFTFFWHRQSPFSQHYMSNFEIDGIVYNCAEQYMMHQKALLFDDLESAHQIMKASDPYVQKKIGRNVANYDDKKWDSVCRDVVKRANIAKFSQNIALYNALMKTDGTVLVEASPYDRKWGIGLSETDSKAHDRTMWRGKNLLGNILTEVREEIKKK